MKIFLLFLVMFIIFSCVEVPSLEYENEFDPENNDSSNSVSFVNVEVYMLSYHKSKNVKDLINKF